MGCQRHAHAPRPRCTCPCQAYIIIGLSSGTRKFRASAASEGEQLERVADQLSSAHVHMSKIRMLRGATSKIRRLDAPLPTAACGICRRYSQNGRQTSRNCKSFPQLVQPVQKLDKLLAPLRPIRHFRQKATLLNGTLRDTPASRRRCMIGGESSVNETERIAELSCRSSTSSPP